MYLRASFTCVYKRIEQELAACSCIFRHRLPACRNFSSLSNETQSVRQIFISLKDAEPPCHTSKMNYSLGDNLISFSTNKKINKSKQLMNVFLDIIENYLLSKSELVVFY